MRAAGLVERIELLVNVPVAPIETAITQGFKSRPLERRRRASLVERRGQRNLAVRLARAPLLVLVDECGSSQHSAEARQKQQT